VFFPALVASMLYGVAGSDWDSLELKGCNTCNVNKNDRIALSR